MSNLKDENSNNVTPNASRSDASVFMHTIFVHLSKNVFIISFMEELSPKVYASLLHGSIGYDDPRKRRMMRDQVDLFCRAPPKHQ